MRPLLPIAAAAAVIMGLAPAPRADVPDAGQSTVDPCLIVCPLGDVTFTVVVRNAVGLPIPLSLVQVNFCAGNASRCDPLTVCQAGGLTGLDGRVVLSFMAGGISATPVEIHADGLLLASRPIASPDQDGDLVVDAADIAIAQAKLGTADPTMDLDCDQGVVDQADLDAQAAHVGHQCDQKVPARPETWDRVKRLYRDTSR
jgi:hypothetical protein